MASEPDGHVSPSTDCPAAASSLADYYRHAPDDQRAGHARRPLLGRRRWRDLRGVASVGPRIAAEPQHAEHSRRSRRRAPVRAGERDCGASRQLPGLVGQSTAAAAGIAAVRRCVLHARGNAALLLQRGLLLRDVARDTGRRPRGMSSGPGAGCRLAESVERSRHACGAGTVFSVVANGPQVLDDRMLRVELGNETTGGVARPRPSCTSPRLWPESHVDEATAVAAVAWPEPRALPFARRAAALISASAVRQNDVAQPASALDLVIATSAPVTAWRGRGS
jgi:hypothetical protein